MGGYDCCLFKKEDMFPKSLDEFKKRVKESMFKKYGGDKIEFNSIWYSIDSDFRVIFHEDEMWGVLDW